MTIFNRSAVDRPPTRQLETNGLAPERRPPPIEERHRPSMRAFDQSEDDANEDLATSRYALAAAVGDPAPPTEAGVVHFSKSYMAHGEPVSRITLRRPVTKEIRTAGTPFRIVLKADGVTIEDVEQRWDAVAKYIELLATPPLPPHTVDQLEFEDLAACAGVLFDFFLPTSRSKKS